MNLKNFVGPLIKLVVSVGPLEVCRSPLFVICLQSKWQDPKTKTISLMDPKELPWTIPIQILKRLDVSPLKKKHAKKTSLKPRYHISIMSGVFRYFPCNPNPSSSPTFPGADGFDICEAFCWITFCLSWCTQWYHIKATELVLETSDWLVVGPWFFLRESQDANMISMAKTWLQRIWKWLIWLFMTLFHQFCWILLCLELWFLQFLCVPIVAKSSRV